MNCTLRRIAAFIIVTSGVAALPGCGKQPPETPDTTASQAGVKGSGALQPLRETWDVYRLQGKRIGYGRTTVRPESRDGEQLLIIDSTNHMVTMRGGQTSQQDIRTVSLETPEGRLMQFESEMRLGPSPVKMIGTVHDYRIDLKVIGPGAGTVKRQSIGWSADIEGPLAVEQSLRRRPMQPGERRTLKMIVPDLASAVVASVELNAMQVEPTKLLGRSSELMRIEAITQLPGGQKIESTVWTDRKGEMLKSVTAGLEQCRVSQAEATAGGDVAELDLLSSMSVKVDPPILNAHHTTYARYRVRLEGADPTRVFAIGVSQSVQSIDAHTAEIAVYAIRPASVDGNRAAPIDPPNDDDRRPNSFIQSDDATIVADAAKAADSETDPWRVAVALERYVKREVRATDFSQAFSSAAEVAKSRVGDCTEHAVYLAAMARARGIPARVAIGLVYIQRDAAFGYHMWTEVYVGNRWVPIDGTLGLGGIGAGHLKIAHSNLQGATAGSAFLPVVQLLGRLKIDVLETR